MCPTDRTAAEVNDTVPAGEAPSPALLADLVTANHILSDQG